MKKNKIKVTRLPPADINTSWDSIYIITPLSGQSQENAEKAWEEIKAKCGEFWTTLLADHQSDEFYY
jgi:hypothetical protein